jgi:hypothetical protein
MSKIALGSRPAKQEIKAYSDVLQFGKHRGHTVEWVLDHAPGYIIWLVENGWTVDGWIILDAEMMEYEEYDDWSGIDVYDFMD